MRCYADGKTPKEAGDITGLSHVSIYRLYRLIRERLFYVGIYRTKVDFIEHAKRGEEEGPYFDWSGFDRFIREKLGAHRGIRKQNYNLYLSQAIFRFEAQYSGGQLYRLLLITIKATGPLNRKPVGFKQAAFQREILRLNMAEIRKSMRELDWGSEFQTYMRAATDWLESRTEEFVETLEELEKPHR
ncbi:hypothetical protein NGM99_17105 [Mesorhizobium sp. RP14(2022)]|uniref:Uncharacterized protein n=1 Tax=Mesorhizobium liriopis TaxID=2953882 RepID=A0ABT1C9M8_9HYPH|nr:hypothetical protein [Mesorhizobium liriopis]MCO6051505.1 hypothetical protein [Mesorhizobium liriopis]